MNTFQRWLLAASLISCLVISFYSYTINHNLKVIEARQRGQIATTGQSLWFSWHNCADKLTWVLRASDRDAQAEVLEYLSNVQLHCEASSQFIYNYNAALKWPVKPWWNLSLGSGNVIGFVQLFDYYSVQIGHIKSTIKEEGSVSAVSRDRIQQLYNDITTFTEKIPEPMLQKGNISEIHQAIVDWCGTINDVEAKESIRLREEQYQDSCK
ncbi:hypothetical protein [Herpetosiphon giganteus]|uniref:hypothetical protein n=1 Tax=Herpetosiphon giganteus TaxID=2029754 RepID=UPI00195B861B|nr:hypothetical protein [Herpetosiphon giganteus]MBM7842136.1 hypothetical protein [Herpetosiphon giganteus]